VNVESYWDQDFERPVVLENASENVEKVTSMESKVRLVGIESVVVVVYSDIPGSIRHVVADAYAKYLNVSEEWLAH